MRALLHPRALLSQPPTPCGSRGVSSVDPPPVLRELAATARRRAAPLAHPRCETKYIIALGIHDHEAAPGPPSNRHTHAAGHHIATSLVRGRTPKATRKPLGCLVSTLKPQSMPPPCCPTPSSQALSDHCMYPQLAAPSAQQLAAHVILRHPPKHLNEPLPRVSRQQQALLSPLSACGKVSLELSPCRVSSSIVHLLIRRRYICLAVCWLLPPCSSCPPLLPSLCRLHTAAPQVS